MGKKEGVKGKTERKSLESEEVGMIEREGKMEKQSERRKGREGFKEEKVEEVGNRSSRKRGRKERMTDIRDGMTGKRREMSPLACPLSFLHLSFNSLVTLTEPGVCACTPLLLLRYERPVTVTSISFA